MTLEGRSYYLGILLKNERGPFQGSYERLRNWDSDRNRIDHVCNNAVPICFFENVSDMKTHKVKMNRADFFAQVNVNLDKTLWVMPGDHETVIQNLSLICPQVHYDSNILVMDILIGQTDWPGTNELLFNVFAEDGRGKHQINGKLYHKHIHKLLSKGRRIFRCKSETDVTK